MTVQYPAGHANPALACAVASRLRQPSREMNQTDATRLCQLRTPTWLPVPRVALAVPVPLVVEPPPEVHANPTAELAILVPTVCGMIERPTKRPAFSTVL